MSINKDVTNTCVFPLDILQLNPLGDGCETNASNNVFNVLSYVSLTAECCWKFTLSAAANTMCTTKLQTFEIIVVLLSSYHYEL
jgi:hypothetical protein